MSNTECTFTIADIYGAEWWERNKAELERDWEWGFGRVDGNKTYASAGRESIYPVSSQASLPRIILHRRRPKPPTLREVYGVDEVTIPQGWEWAGEWRFEKEKDDYLTKAGVALRSYSDRTSGDYRLILRERPKKVWFKCEAEPRVPRNGDWFYSYGVWGESTKGADGIYLCATRHEEVDQTVQVVTQAMVDKVGL